MPSRIFRFDQLASDLKFYHQLISNLSVFPQYDDDWYWNRASQGGNLTITVTENGALTLQVYTRNLNAVVAPNVHLIHAVDIIKPIALRTHGVEVLSVQMGQNVCRHGAFGPRGSHGTRRAGAKHAKKVPDGLREKKWGPLTCQYDLAARDGQGQGNHPGTAR